MRKIIKPMDGTDPLKKICFVISIARIAIQSQNGNRTRLIESYCFIIFFNYIYNGNPEFTIIFMKVFISITSIKITMSK